MTPALGGEKSAREPTAAEEAAADEAAADEAAIAVAPATPGATVPAPESDPTAPAQSVTESTPGTVEPPRTASGAVSSANQPPSAAGPSAKPGSRRPRPYRRLVIALAALTAVAAGAIGLTLALVSSPGRTAAPSGTSSRSVSPSAPAHDATASANPSGSPASARASDQASPSSSASSPGSGGVGYGALPAGYHRFTNSTGFSIGVPDGWQIQHVGHYVYIIDPSNADIYLLIDQSDAPKPNPLLDWEQQAANRASTYPDYHLIRLESVYYPQAEKAADWEFTYSRDGILVHILNRNVLANAHHAYALYWSTPESDWNAYYHDFQGFADTFRPAK